MNAHNIKALGLCKVGGRHLSDASNEPTTFADIEAVANADARAILREPWTDKRAERNCENAMALQQARPDALTLACSGGLNRE